MYRTQTCGFDTSSTIHLRLLHTHTQNSGSSSSWQFRATGFSGWLKTQCTHRILHGRKRVWLLFCFRHTQQHVAWQHLCLLLPKCICSVQCVMCESTHGPDSLVVGSVRLQLVLNLVRVPARKMANFSMNVSNMTISSKYAKNNKNSAVERRWWWFRSCHFNSLSISSANCDIFEVLITSQSKNKIISIESLGEYCKIAPIEGMSCPTWVAAQEKTGCLLPLVTRIQNWFSVIVKWNHHNHIVFSRPINLVVRCQTTAEHIHPKLHLRCCEYMPIAAVNTSLLHDNSKTFFSSLHFGQFSLWPKRYSMQFNR